MANIGFIGFGRMGSALAKGAVAARVLKPTNIIAFDVELQAQRDIKKLKAHVAKEVTQVVNSSDLIFLCVKPQMMKQALEPILQSVSSEKRRKRCFVSIAAGIPIGRLETWLGGGVPVVRVMPNTPALLAAGVSAMSVGKFAKPSHEARVKKILTSVGEMVRVNERDMDAVTAVSGSGPAYAFYLAEAMLDAAKALGLPDEAARRLVHQTMFGAGRMLAVKKESAGELRKQVTSPGGTTAAAIAVLDQKNLKQIVVEAIQNAARRSAELSKI